MDSIATKIPGVILVVPKVYVDSRGWFFESYSSGIFHSVGINNSFIQDNHSFSAAKNTIRGLHFQNPPNPQAKLVRCTRGAIRDVVVDIRKGSPFYLHWVAYELTDENKYQIFIPRGFAHGFITLVDNTEVQYKVDSVYAPDSDRCIRYSDPDIGIEWGTDMPVLSDKDMNAPLLKDSDVAFNYFAEERNL